MRHCLCCGGTVLDCQETNVGSQLSVKLFCINGHQSSWKSQPLIKNTPAGNLLSSAVILFSGNTFERISQFASFLNLHFISNPTFYSIQKKYLLPVVEKAWEEEKWQVLNDAKVAGFVNLSGDGRCDSPGHSAKYGTYTLMEDTGKIITFNVVQSTEVSSSNAMEKEGFERCLEEVEKQVPVHRISTDRHISISSTMNKNHPHISHQYDVWHLSKSITKKLRNKAKLKGNENLALWIKSISNHLWWCSSTCNKNAEELLEKWKSVLYHISNKHTWTGNTCFHKFCHPCLTENEEKWWLSPTSQAYVAAEELVCEKKQLKNLHKLIEFCHTGELEVYHSLLLKYCPKREHFSFKGMVARTELAALDHNSNVNREQAVLQSGVKKGEARYRTSFTKQKKQWVVKPMKGKKEYGYVDRLLESTVHACENGES